jgi:hypothetical protein
MPEGQRVEAQECRDFMALMQADSKWTFLTIEDRFFAGHDTVASPHLNCFSYAQLFGQVSETGIPFGIIMKELCNQADLAIGVPTGPQHLAVAHPALPTVGIWLTHMPTWYDEPNDNSVHIIGKYVREKWFNRREGSFLNKGELHFDTREASGRVITGQEAFNAAQYVMEKSKRNG